MVNRCVAAGCSNTPSDRVSLLKLPSDGILTCIWEKQVQRTLAQWKATKHSPFFVVTFLLRTCFEGGGLPWRSGMEGSEGVWWRRAGCVVGGGQRGCCSKLSDTVRHSELPEHLCSGLLGESLVVCQCGRGGSHRAHGR